MFRLLSLAQAQARPPQRPLSFWSPSFLALPPQVLRLPQLVMRPQPQPLSFWSPSFLGLPPRVLRLPQLVMRPQALPRLPRGFRPPTTKAPQPRLIFYSGPPFSWLLRFRLPQLVRRPLSFWSPSFLALPPRLLRSPPTKLLPTLPRGFRPPTTKAPPTLPPLRTAALSRLPPTHPYSTPPSPLSPDVPAPPFPLPLSPPMPTPTPPPMPTPTDTHSPPPPQNYTYHSTSTPRLIPRYHHSSSTPSSLLCSLDPFQIFIYFFRIYIITLFLNAFQFFARGFRPPTTTKAVFTHTQRHLYIFLQSPIRYNYNSIYNASFRQLQKHARPHVSFVGFPYNFRLYSKANTVNKLRK